MVAARAEARPSPPSLSIRWAVPEAVTYAVEIAVGAGCLAAAPGAWRRGIRWVAGLLVISGLAAVVHAIVALTE
jgi:hypothetical protein